MILSSVTNFQGHILGYVQVSFKIVNLFAVTDGILTSRWRSMTGDVVFPGVLVGVLTQEAEVSVVALMLGTGVEGVFHFHNFVICYVVLGY